MDSMDGKEIRVRCERCKGTGVMAHVDCGACFGRGYTVEVFRLKPKPKSLREQLEGKEQDNG